MGNIRVAQTATSKNTGRIGAQLMPSFAKAIVLVPYAWNLAIADTLSNDDIVALLINAVEQGLSAVNVYADRFQLIGQFESFEDKSEAANAQKLGFGKEVYSNRGTQRHDYTYDNGGMNYHNKVLSFSGKEKLYKALVIDAQGVIYGANQRDPATGLVIGIQGIELSNLFVHDRMEANYQTEATFRISVTFLSNAERNEECYAVATGRTGLISAFEAMTVNDVQIVGPVFTATRVMTFQLKAGSGSVNLGDTFGSTLANIGAFVAANKGSGTSVAITSVTYSAVTKLYTVTLTAGAGYVVGQTLKFNLNTVTALTVLLISYYEGKEIEIVMT